MMMKEPIAIPAQGAKPLRLAPLSHVPKAMGYEDWLLVSTLRQWNFYSKSTYTAAGLKKPGNGFDMCVVRVGGKILINLDLFEEWLLKQNKNQSATKVLNGGNQ